MKNVKTAFAAIVIPVSLLIAVLIYLYVFGNSANFIEGNSAGEPVKTGTGYYL
jgi:biopolymer transport protein ExbB